MPVPALPSKGRVSPRARAGPLLLRLSVLRKLDPAGRGAALRGSALTLPRGAAKRKPATVVGLFAALCRGVTAGAETLIPRHRREMQDLHPAAAAPARGQLPEGMRGPRSGGRTPPPAPSPPAWGCATRPVGPARLPQPTRPQPFAGRRARGSGAAAVMGSAGDGEEAPWTWRCWVDGWTR